MLHILRIILEGQVIFYPPNKNTFAAYDEKGYTIIGTTHLEDLIFYISFNI